MYYSICFNFEVALLTESSISAIFEFYDFVQENASLTGYLWPLHGHKWLSSILISRTDNSLERYIL